MSEPETLVCSFLDACFSWKFSSPSILYFLGKTWLLLRRVYLEKVESIFLQSFLGQMLESGSCLGQSAACFQGSQCVWKVSGHRLEETGDGGAGIHQDHIFPSAEFTSKWVSVLFSHGVFVFSGQHALKHLYCSIINRQFEGFHMR